YCGEESPTWTVPASGQYEEYVILMSMESCEGNSTIKKTLRVAPTTNLPTVDFSASNRRVSTNSVVELTHNTKAGCSYEWVISPTTGWDFETGYDEFSPDVEVKFIAPG